MPPTRELPVLAALAAATGLACAASPTGRSQLIVFPDSEMAAMGVAAYEQLKAEMPISPDAARQRYVRCVADAITRELQPGEGPGGAWEVTLFEEPSANAFALPGAKIGVHTGLLEVATDRDQLATVVGHEVAHVLARHSNERVSTQYAAQAGLQLAGVIAGGGAASQQLMALLGVGAQVGIVLPFSRAQESEADVLGLELMARAGFDPRLSVALWRNMSAAAGGAAPPEWLSTHPSNERRIAALEARVPEALLVHERARAAGRRPSCS